MPQKKKARSEDSGPAPPVETTGAVPGCATDEPSGGTAPLFRLTVERTDGADANLPVRWCLSKEALAELQRQEARDPHLLIVVARETGSTELGQKLEEVRRLLLPLDRGLDRVVFPRAGNYRVFAMVVWSRNGEPAKRWTEMHDRLLAKGHTGSGSAYIRNFVNGEEFQGKKVFLRPDSVLHTLDHAAELHISVDERFFAEEPSKRLAWYVNLMCEGKPRDECHFRKRLLWAFGIKWLLVLIWCVLAGIIRTAYALFLALIGRRNINLRPIWHPFGWSVADVDGNEEHKIPDSRGYWTQTTRKGEPRRLLFFLSATPLLWALYAGAAWYLWQERSRFRLLGEIDWGFFPIFLAGVAGTFIVMFFALVLIFRSAEKNYRAGEDERARRKTAKENAAISRKKGRDYRELARFYRERLQPLACPEGLSERPAGARPKVTRATLPPTHQTVRLWFSDLKAGVCKPFQQ